MENFLLEQQQLAERISILTEFIQTNPSARELKRALAVKLALQSTPYTKITTLLGMHKSCITKWKQKFDSKGLDGIKLGYQGSKSYLTLEERDVVITWLQTKEYINIDEVFTYLDERYDVTYQSKQSYYDLMKAANISCKKSQKVNPRFNPELVKKKREEIVDFLSQHQTEIEVPTLLEGTSSRNAAPSTGELVVFFVDECHLMGGDVCGYVWAQTNTKIEIPIKNIKDRQTYFGALDYQTQEFIVHEYQCGNSSNTIAFLPRVRYIIEG
jgi:putative transposase